MTSKRWINVS